MQMDDLIVFYGKIPKAKHAKTRRRWSLTCHEHGVEDREIHILKTCKNE